MPGISVSYLEDASIQKVHKQLGIERLQSAIKPDGTHWNKAQIIQEFGFPVLSKEIAGKIETLANPTEKKQNCPPCDNHRGNRGIRGISEEKQNENVQKVA